MNLFDPKTAFFVSGVLYLVMPLTVWSILNGRHDRINVRCWALGGLLYGLGLTLVGLRTTIPDWLSIGVANPVAFASYALRIAVLRRELGKAPHPRVLLGGWAVVSAAFLWAHAGSDVAAPRLVVANVAHLIGAAALVALSWQLHRQRPSSSALMLAVAYGCFALALVLRMAFVVARGEEAAAFSSTVDFALMFVTAIIAALYGNLGYIGMALEDMGRRDLQRASELAAEQARRLEAERHAQEQATLLQERTQALALRDEMLVTLAHEVRQPLNNASAAIESAGAVMRGAPQPEAAAATAYRLQRASSVLTRVMNSVDNTLADAALLADGRPLATADADIDTVVQLAIGDIDPTEVNRIWVTRTTSTRTACFNQSLLRLALRNLLLNAILYARPGSAVVVCIADSDRPLGLLIDVCDEGPGVPVALADRIFERGVRDSTASRGHGLGLHIVRSVMRMHGGDAVLHDNGPNGARFRLVLPAFGRRALEPITSQSAWP